MSVNLKNDLTCWLLEEENPGVRYLTLRDVIRLPGNDPDLIIARENAYHHGPISIVLDAMQPEGYWMKPGPGYLPKYFSSVWALILLAQLGASIEYDARIMTACQYILENSLTRNGQFTTAGTPSSTADCLQGNLLAALFELGCNDPRMDIAFDWMARTVTGEGLAPLEEKKAELRYYAGKCGPNFSCGSNNKMPCAWGASKVMLAFSKLSKDRYTPRITKAVDQGIEFLFSVDPVEATYPSGWNDKPSGNWWKLGFPIFYVTDILQIVEVLVNLGYGGDPRLNNTIDYLIEKQNAQGQWSLDYDYKGKTWGDYGQKKQANKWVTLRVVKALNGVMTM